MSEQATVTTLVVAEPTTRRALILADALKEAGEQRQLLVKYVKEQMREDVDYGTIPGTKKPSLWKAGAEKLTELYRCAPKFTIVEKTVDWERGFFHYTFRCRLVQRDSGAVLAEGFGSCSSWESKYRWRDAQRKCPQCTAPAIFESKQEEGFYCWKKKGGCGAKFQPTDSRILSQVAGKVENPDPADVVNTVLKMAKKRAHVDGAIALAGCSDLFTQDIEDTGVAPEEVAAQPPRPQSQVPIQGRTAAIKEKLKAKAGPIVDVAPGETEEQATARATPVWARAVKLLRDAGIADSIMGPYVKSVTGKGASKDLVEEDLLKLEAKLAEREVAAP